nr:MAG TPA: DIRP protein [Caudoviricetes sp.]
MVSYKVPKKLPPLLVIGTKVLQRDKNGLKSFLRGTIIRP